MDAVTGVPFRMACDAYFHRQVWREDGFTLIEVILGGVTLAVAIAAILGAYVGQVTLNEHARNLSLATNDANRVIEQMRQLNAGCTGSPNVTQPPITGVAPCNGAATTDWDDWLRRCGGGESIGDGTTASELIVVTCQKREGGTASADYCDPSDVPGDADQIGGEWTSPALGVGAGPHDPIRVTVSVCWRHRQRTIGECNFVGGVLGAVDGAGGAPNNVPGVIESPVMLTTLVTCRG